MHTKMYIAIAFVLLAMVSGCTTESVKPHLVNTSNSLSEATFKYWDAYVENSNKRLVAKTTEKLGVIMEFDLCLLHVYENPEFYAYYLDECNFSKINELRRHDNYTAKTSYVGFSVEKAVLRVAEKINSSFFALYTKEKVAEDEPVDTLIKSVANKVIDMGIMVFVVASEGTAWTYLTSEINDCNESVPCINSFFEMQDTAIEKIMQETKFDDVFVNSCKLFILEDVTNVTQIINSQIVARAKIILGEIFRKGGYNGNPDDYVSYNSICERAGKVYSAIYDGLLDDISEPVQRFYIATAFFMLSKLGETRESVSNSLDQFLT